MENLHKQGVSKEHLEKIGTKNDRIKNKKERLYLGQINKDIMTIETIYP